MFGRQRLFLGNSTKVNWTSSSILEAHIRGNDQPDLSKKGYRLTLKKQNSTGPSYPIRTLFGLRKDDEWILNAMYTDSSKIRDKLCADLWNQFGAERPDFPKANFGTRMTYVEVFFNIEYWGLYLLAEPVDSRQLNRKKEASGEEEFSYKSITSQSLDTSELLTQSEYGPGSWTATS